MNAKPVDTPMDLNTKLLPRQGEQFQTQRGTKDQL